MLNRPMTRNFPKLGSKVELCTDKKSKKWYIYSKMTLGTIKNELGKWQFQFVCNSHSPHRFGLNPYMAFWIVKLKNYINPGVPIEKKDYDGMIFALRAPVFVGEVVPRQYSLNDWLQWDKNPVPTWIPKWVLMEKYSYPDREDPDEIHKSTRPRQWLINLIAYKFTIYWPVILKFI